jgi:deoxyribodipyrimidine photolyase-related protein
MKLVMHRATMKYYFDYLQLKLNEYTKLNNLSFMNIEYKYFEYKKNLYKIFNSKDIINIYNPIDHDIINEFKKIKCKLNIYDNLTQICSVNDYDEYLNEKNPMIHHSFYIWFRKKYNILMNNNKPIGNKWSFDKENRIPFPKNQENEIEKLSKFNYIEDSKINKYLTEAKKYVNNNFKNNHGSSEYYLPITFEQAKYHFKKFIDKKLNNFGPYEDAVHSDITYGYHSVMSPIINIGLITPNYIIKYLLSYMDKLKIKIQSLEGYIRQLFWREFCIFTYLYKSNELEKGNFFNHTNKINNTWYNATTPIEPINNIINKALTYGWVHHIERLMYLGNLFLLLQIHPKYVYKWFMELFIDAYPWVMIPNVYGMSQFSAGNIMMKRPYFSSSNYLFKLSNYKKIKYEKIIITGDKSIINNNTNKNTTNENNGTNNYEWYEIWNALYYNFINNNSAFLSKNYSTANSVLLWKRKNSNEKNSYINISKLFIDKYL